MKTKILVWAILCLIVLSFSFFSSNKNGNQPSNINSNIIPPNRNSFLIGGISNGWVKDDYQYITDLGINVWHFYSLTNSGWSRIGAVNDLRETYIANYIGEIKNRIDDNVLPPL